MRGGWALASIVGALGAWACRPDAFTCSDDVQCQGGPTEGTCVEGYCAFPSDVCSSGLQWGEHAGAASGTCVPAGGTDTGSDTALPEPTEGSTGPGPTSLDGPLDTSASGSDGPRPGEVEFRDDELSGEFAAGTMRGVEWTGDRLALPPDVPLGTFTSRVFDAGETVIWQTVEWQPDGPYGKPLPDAGDSERGYLEGNADMTGTVLLMHMDGDGAVAWVDGTPVLDASGAGSHGTVVADDGVLPLVPGVFGSAIDDRLDTYVSIPTPKAPMLELGVDDFTWALWVRTDSTCNSNQVYLGVDDFEGIGPDEHAHLWLGCTDDDWSECPTLLGGPHPGGVLRSSHDDARDGGAYCSTVPLADDQWHHLAMVKEGHESATLHLYVDGVLEHASDASFSKAIEYPSAPDFTIGALSRGSYPTVGVLDEVAIWRRELDAAEVAALHRRGVTRLRVAVRVCSEPECADEPPFGPELSDPPHATGPGLPIPLVERPAGRYAQYRLVLGGPMPALRSVTIRGTVP